MNGAPPALGRVRARRGEERLGCTRQTPDVHFSISVAAGEPAAVTSPLASTNWPPAGATDVNGQLAMEFRERRFVISNGLGLHARAAVQLVMTANRFRSDVWVAANGIRANGRSVMGLLTLAASQRASLVVTCEGEDAELAMEAVAAIIEAGFGEK